MPRLTGFILAILLVVAGAASAVTPTDVKPAPVATFDLADFQGQVVLVDFWASWCVPCRASLPWLNSMQAKYAEQGLQVVMVNLDKKASAAAKMAAQITPGIRQFLDPKGELAARYKLEGMPSSYLYDRQGQLISRHIGFLKSEASEKEQAIEEALQREGS